MQGNVYLLIAGLLFGMLLGPFVLGRLAPQLYDQCFPVGEAQQALDEFDAEMHRRLDAARQVGATSEYLPELEQNLLVQRLKIQQQLEQARALNVRPFMLSMLLALIVIMLIESAHGQPHTAVGLRLATARYALLAIWLALLLAVPRPLAQVSVGFLALVVAVALLAALIPLRSTATQNA